MSNEFRKLIRKEFGHPTYLKFYEFFKQSVEKGKMDVFTEDESKFSDDDIFRYMYGILKGRDIESLRGMQKRLSETMINAMGICKSYFLVGFIYSISMIIMMSAVENPRMMYLGMMILTLLFLYKTVQYVSNKFCIIDAQLIIIYKCVLDKLLSACNNKQGVI